MEEKVKDIVSEILDIDVDKITRDSNVVKDLEADSLSIMEILVEIENEFDIELTEDEAKGLKTFGDLMQILEAKNA